MLIKLVVFSIFPLQCVLLTHSYRILVVYPTPALSHQRGQQAITQKLAEIGHELVVISPIPPLQTHPNIRYIDVSCVFKLKQEIQDMAQKNLTSSEQFSVFLENSRKTIEVIMETEQVQELLQNKHEYFDGVIVEFLGYSTFHAFAVHFNAALIGVLSMEAPPFLYQLRGNPAHPILHPGSLLGDTQNPSLFQRIKLLYQSFVGHALMSHIFSPMFENLTKTYFNLDTKGDELVQLVDLHIEQVSPVLYNVRPLLPNTVQIGFIHIEPPKTLPQDLQHFMDASKHGVIYLSFGSTVSGAAIGSHFIKILQDVLSSLKYDVIWKFESDTMENKPANVKLMKWVPQPDLLAHKNLRLFITQGGAQSMEEFISRGVPVVVIPFFGDQEYNAAHIEKLGVGKSVLRNDLTRECLTNAINEVVSNSKYRERSKVLYKLGTDTPLSAVETAVWWIEYAIRNKGAPHLKYAGAQMPWYQWLLMDILAVHIVGLLVLTWLAIKICKLCCLKAKIKQD